VSGNQQITNLPLNGRDISTRCNFGRHIPSTTVAANGAQVGVSIGGQAGTLSHFCWMESTTTRRHHADAWRSEGVIKPSIDAIQEFKVVTNL